MKYIILFFCIFITACFNESSEDEDKMPETAGKITVIDGGLVSDNDSR